VNRVLRVIFGLQREKVTLVRRKLHNEELNDTYFSTNIIRIIKSRKKKGAGNVACKEEKYIQYCGGTTERKETTWTT